MRRGLSATVLLLVLTLVSVSASGQGLSANGPSLTGEMEAYKIILDKENREIAVPAEQVFPRDTIEYTLRYWNAGTASASGVNLTGPIPAGTVYLDETATAIEGIHPLFSIDDGKSYQEAPVTYVVLNKQGKEERRIATPDMITHIKWEMDGILDIGQEVTVSYRVQVR
jgi:uncharacterized repeat protein (TIGR01451 family)